MTAKAAKPAVRIRWRATKPDGIGHAFAGRTRPALCGAKNEDERFDWPRRSRCLACDERMLLGGFDRG